MPIIYAKQPLTDKNFPIGKSPVSLFLNISNRATSVCTSSPLNKIKNQIVSKDRLIFKTVNRTYLSGTVVSNANLGHAKN